MTNRNRLCLHLLLIALLAYIAAPVAAQSPNTATVVVVVVDQTGAVVQDAKVSVMNTATGAVREAVSGSDGSATIPALSLTGSYTVNVSKGGFGDEELKDITLRSGETATMKVKLLVGSQKAEVIVYGTTEGVRADPQLGRRVDSPTIDETPILGRKVTTLPLLNSAFRQAKGTGDLFVNATYFVTGVGGRRQTTVLLDGANNDRPVIDGRVIGKSAFRGTPTSDVAIFVENRIRTSERTSILLRLEGFNIFNHGNYLGRGQTIFGDAGVPDPTFGQLVAVPIIPVGNTVITNALPAFANVDPPRMFQLQARFIF